MTATAATKQQTCQMIFRVQNVCITNVKFTCIELSLGDAVAGEKFGIKKKQIY